MEIYRMVDIIPLLGLPNPPYNRSSYNVSCPCCDRNSRQKHFNINLAKNVFRCPKCDLFGGVLDMYSLFTGEERKNIAYKIRDRIGTTYQGNNSYTRPAYTEPKIISREVSDIQTRHRTYKALLSKLTLASDHYENLLNRGLSKQVIIRNGYRTTPVIGMKALARQLQSEGYCLSGVPGFYKASDGHWTFVGNNRGLLIPARNIQGFIQGLQIRRDNTQQRKFRWVSSTDRLEGCKACGWTHLVGKAQETMLLIEGPLKADVVNHLTGLSVLAIPGVNTLSELESTLIKLKESGAKKIMTAFDMDFLKNRHVQKGYNTLTKLLCRMDFQYGTYLWDEQYNGLDDYIWARKSMQEAK